MNDHWDKLYQYAEGNPIEALAAVHEILRQRGIDENTQSISISVDDLNDLFDDIRFLMGMLATIDSSIPGAKVHKEVYSGLKTSMLKAEWKSHKHS